MVVWTIALDVVKDVRSSIAMFLFIIEESMQSIGMANWIAFKDEDFETVLNNVAWSRENLLEPALDFVKNFGAPAFPLNIAYETFYKTFDENLKVFERRALAKLNE